jgi:succinate dehydrogenase / fumarate reductase membrane anchor subunit
MRMKDTPLWTWHVIAGIVLLVLLGMHMTVMHLNDVLNIAGPGTVNPEGGAPINWANVVARAQEVGFAIFYVVLLGAGLFHGLYGLRNIIHELNPSPGVMKIVTALILIAGFGLFALGTWAAIAARTVALAPTL